MPMVDEAFKARPEGGNERIAQGNRRRSESRAELAPAIPSEEEEDEVNALGRLAAAIAPCKGKDCASESKAKLA